jgi:hypothetical protein
VAARAGVPHAAVCVQRRHGACFFFASSPTLHFPRPQAIHYYPTTQPPKKPNNNKQPFFFKNFYPTKQKDAEYKVWAWERGLLCAYKDDQQQPLPYDVTSYRRLAWADAPACASTPGPATTAPDRLGRLWGWELVRCGFVAKQPTQLSWL